MNHENSSDRNAQLLAVYLNWELKTYSDESKLEDHIEIILSLFRSLNSSDVFEKTYTRQLAMRLLSKKGYDIELEKRIAFAFKNECGVGFNPQTELMFSSISESESLTESFKALTTKLPFTDFNFKVLEQKTWPIDTSMNTAETDDQEEAKTTTVARASSKASATRADAKDSGKSDNAKQMNVLILPKPLSDLFSNFSKFYKEQFKGKRLDIIHQYGSCLI